MKPSTRQELEAKIQEEEKEIERLILKERELEEHEAGATLDEIFEISQEIDRLGRPGSQEAKELQEKRQTLDRLDREYQITGRLIAEAELRFWGQKIDLNILKRETEAPSENSLSKNSLSAAHHINLLPHCTANSSSPRSPVSNHNLTSILGWDCRMGGIGR